MINYQATDFMAGQLADQYAKQREFGYKYQEEGDLQTIFYGQAAKLSANGLTSIYDVGEKDGVLINKVTNEPIEKIGLKGNWQEDPTSINIGPNIQLEDRGKFKRWGFDTSVEGMAHYGIDFQDGVPVFTPYYKDTSTKIFGMNLEDVAKLAIAATALYFGGSYLLGGEAAAAGATAGTAGTGAAAGTGAGTGLTAGAAGAGTGTAIVGTPGVSTIYTVAAPSIGVSTLAPQAIGATGSLLAADAALASGGAPISTATAVPAGQLAYPAVEVASIPNASLAPTSFQAALPGLGVETAASAAPFTAAPGSFQAALPSLLAPAATSGLGITDALRAANSINSLLNPPTIQQQAGLPQQSLLGGGQARGVDFSPLYQNSIVGLLPLAERYRRSLI
jgi:hypothetical protein